jgi:hypothetical protein
MPRTQEASSIYNINVINRDNKVNQLITIFSNVVIIMSQSIDVYGPVLEVK